MVEVRFAVPASMSSNEGNLSAMMGVAFTEGFVCGRASKGGRAVVSNCRAWSSSKERAVARALIDAL